MAFALPMEMHTDRTDLCYEPRARWVEAESIHLEQMGLSFDAITEQVSRVSRGPGQRSSRSPRK